MRLVLVRTAQGKRNWFRSGSVFMLSLYFSFILLFGASAQVFAQDKPALYAVVVGVKTFKYPEQIAPLYLSDKDAQDFAAFLKEREDLLGKVHVTLLLNEQATKENVMAAMREQFGSASKKDIAVVFLSGHGTPHPSKPGEYYFVTYDTRVDDLYDTALMVNDRRLFGKIPADKVLLLADACHSGGFVSGIELEQIAKGPLNQFSVFRELPGRVAMSSSAPGEVSYERKAFGNSVFTHFLIKGLRGEAARQSTLNPGTEEKITIRSLFDYVFQNTRAATDGKQNPVMYAAKPTLDATIAQVPRFEKPLQIKVQFVYQDEKKEVRALTNESVLKSGQRLGVDFQPESDCYVYIFWWDQTGQVWKMFPNPKYGDATAKVTAGKKYQLPAKQGEAHWYVLNDTPGIETIYFVASRERNQKLESLYEQLEAMAGEARKGTAGQEITGRLEQEVNFMGPADEIVPRADKPQPLSGPVPDRQALFERLGNQIQVSGADAIFKVQFKHE
ncbi:MAG: caspase family protein [Desulfomonilaceae bacterium]